jgi:hypothetical protein
MRTGAARVNGRWYQATGAYDHCAAERRLRRSMVGFTDS